MFKYIGIRGHRGAGKNTFSYLLGVTLDYYSRESEQTETFETVYNRAVDKILELKEDFLATEFNTVFFESFADTAKVMLSQLTGIPNEMMYNDWCKDSVIVNVNDFSYMQARDKLELAAMLNDLAGRSPKKLFSAEELYDMISSTLRDNPYKHIEVHMTLRELIAYFSKYVMQRFFGNNVWIKSLEVNKWDIERFYDSKNRTIYKIFTDCKFPSEISYIKNNGGLIIKVNRDNNVKENTDISIELADDDRFDYEVSWNGDLTCTDVIEDIKRITFNILNK